MDVSRQEFHDVQALVRTLCGLMLTDDKTYLVSTRLESTVRSHGCDSFSDYLNRVQDVTATQMREELIDALTTGETSFNRDGHPFEEFRRRMLPALAEQIRQRRLSGDIPPAVRIWSAGCSTGQEPYSIAMAVSDFVRSSNADRVRPTDFSILATDVSLKALNFAREGRYHERDIARGLTAQQQTRHLCNSGEIFEINPELRRLVEFRRLNFIESFANLGRFGVIFCRNVLIYFDVSTRQSLCDQFHESLEPGGLLILGAAESLYGINSPLQLEQIGATFVYRKVSA